MKTEKYHLYVAPFNQESARAALEEAYSKASRTHVLIYKKGKKPEGYKEITDENLHLLPDADRKWLYETNIEVMRTFVAKHKKEAEKAQKNFLEEFERELEVERKKLKDQERDTE